MVPASDFSAKPESVLRVKWGGRGIPQSKNVSPFGLTFACLTVAVSIVELPFVGSHVDIWANDSG